MALFSAGSSHNCHLVASMSNVKLTYLPGTHLPMVSPKLCPYSITLRHVHHSSQYPHFLLFPKPSPLRRRHSALAFLPADSLRLQHGSPSECSKSNFVLDDCKSSYTTPLKLNFCSLVSSHTPLKIRTGGVHARVCELGSTDFSTLQPVLYGITLVWNNVLL